MQLSRYEDIGQAFREEHAFGTIVTGAAMIAWVKKNANGHAIGADLKIEEPRKRLSNVRRHLNEGLRSENLSEDHRGYIGIDDPKRPSFVIVSLKDHVKTQMKTAFIRSAGAAVAPINSALRASNSLKLEELDEAEARGIEKEREELKAIKEPLGQVYTGEIDRRMIAALIDRGHSEKEARSLVASYATITPYQKLLTKFR